MDLKIRLIVLFALLLRTTVCYFVNVFVLLKGLWRVHLYFFFLLWLLFWLFEDIFEDFLCLEDFLPVFKLLLFKYLLLYVGDWNPLVFVVVGGVFWKWKTAFFRKGFGVIKRIWSEDVFVFAIWTKLDGSYLIVDVLVKFALKLKKKSTRIDANCGPFGRNFLQIYLESIFVCFLFLFR